jgi:hypothetical protein
MAHSLIHHAWRVCLVGAELPIQMERGCVAGRVVKRAQMKLLVLVPTRSHIALQ